MFAPRVRKGRAMATGHCERCDRADLAGRPIEGWLHWRPNWDRDGGRLRPFMIYEHFRYSCDGPVLVEEYGRLYPLEVAQEYAREEIWWGEPLPGMDDGDQPENNEMELVSA